MKRRAMRLGTNSLYRNSAISARKPFPFHVCTMEADGSENKRLTLRKSRYNKKKKTAYSQ